MKLLLLSCCTLLLFFTNAQNKKAIVKINPLALIDDVSFATIQAGIEIPLAARISWYNEAGIHYRKGYYETADTGFVHSGGYKIKTELRYYFSRFLHGAPDISMKGYYIGINLSFIRDLHNTELEYYFQNDSSKKMVDNLGAKKSVYCSSIILGKQAAIGQHWVLDYYTGIGIRYRDIKTVNKEYLYERDALILPIDVTIAGIRTRNDSKAGKSFTCNFSMGIRLCYCF